jgi:hypothetical protein
MQPTLSTTTFVPFKIPTSPSPKRGLTIHPKFKEPEKTAIELYTDPRSLAYISSAITAVATGRFLAELDTAAEKTIDHQKGIKTYDSWNINFIFDWLLGRTIKISINKYSITINKISAEKFLLRNNFIQSPFSTCDLAKYVRNVIFMNDLATTAFERYIFKPFQSVQ